MVVKRREDVADLGFFGQNYPLPDGKESASNAGDLGSIPGSGKSPGGGHSNSLQYSCMENPMDRGARRATVLGVTKSRVRHNLAPEHTRKGGVCKGVDGERAPTRNGEMLQDQSQ